MSVPTPDNPDAAPLHERLDVIEIDETVPPRPEEDIADAARSTPDRHGHGGTAEQRWPQVEAPEPSSADSQTDGDQDAGAVDPADGSEPVASSADDPRP